MGPSLQEELAVERKWREKKIKSLKQVTQKHRVACQVYLGLCIIWLSWRAQLVFCIFHHHIGLFHIQVAWDFHLGKIQDKMDLACGVSLRRVITFSYQIVHMVFGKEGGICEHRYAKGSSII